MSTKNFPLLPPNPLKFAVNLSNHEAHLVGSLTGDLLYSETLLISSIKGLLEGIAGIAGIEAMTFRLLDRMLRLTTELQEIHGQ